MEAKTDKEYVLEGVFSTFNMPNVEESILKYSIIFECHGAIDFRRHILIELSCKPKDGSTEIHPYELYCNIRLPYIHNVIKSKFYDILGHSIHISDLHLMPDLKVYYRCMDIYRHSHTLYDKAEDIEYITLEEAIKRIKKYQLDIVL